MECKKNYYHTKQEAKRYIKDASTKVWKKLNIYKCPQCWYFHFTSKVSETKVYFRNKKYDKNM